MSCILRVSGETLDLAKVLKVISFSPYDTHQKGTPKRRKPKLPHEDSGFKVEVSDAAMSDFPQQCKDAEEFLHRHFVELGRLDKVDEAELDFSYDCRIGTGLGDKRVYVQNDYIPVGLVKLCGELSIGIAITQFPPREENEESEQDAPSNR